MKMADLVTATGMSRQRINDYLNRGLIRSVGREGKARLFDSVAVETLRRIESLRQEGRSLPEIRSLLQQDGGAELRIVALVQPQRDSGKTGLSLAIAREAAGRGIRTLLCDLDPSCASTFALLGRHPKPDWRCVADLLREPGLQPSQAVVSCSIPGLGLLPARPCLEAIRSVPGEGLAALLRRLPAETDTRLLVVDLPDDLSALCRSGLWAATHAVVPLRSATYTRHALSKTLELVADVGSINGLELLSVVLTAAPEDREEEPPWATEIAVTLKEAPVTPGVFPLGREGGELQRLVAACLVDGLGLAVQEG